MQNSNGKLKQFGYTIKPLFRALVLFIAGSSLYLLVLAVLALLLDPTPLDQMEWLIRLIPVLVVAALSLIYYKKDFWRKNTFLFEIFIAIFILSSLIYFFVKINPPHPHSTSAYRDGRRGSDFKQLQLALEFYLEDNGDYPYTQNQCSPVAELWPSMGYILPNGPTTSPTFVNVRDADYYVSVSDDAQSYVLKVEFEDSGNMATNDLDGTILGCDCDDPNYCVGEGLAIP